MPIHGVTIKGSNTQGGGSDTQTEQLSIWEQNRIIGFSLAFTYLTQIYGIFSLSIEVMTDLTHALGGRGT